jgi:hypothetical protein
MAGKDLFTDEEWARVAPVPALVVMAASISDGKAMPSVREITTGAEVFVEAAKDHPVDTLVGELVAGMKDHKPELGDAQPSSTAGVVDELLAQIETGWRTFISKAPSDDVVALRELLTTAAKAVVERLGSGFMGSGEEKVSASEQAFVDRLTRVLAA